MALGVVALLAGRLAWGAAPEIGEKATFNYKTVDGKMITPESVSGHIVIFDFWATWCGPCMKFAPHMVKLSQEYAENGVLIIGVSLDSDVQQMKEVAKKSGFTWPQICDGKGWDSAFSRAWGVRGIPKCAIIGPDATMLWMGHPGQMDKALKDAVAKYPYTPKPKEPEKPKEVEKPVVTAPVVAKTAGVSSALLDAKISAADKDKAAGKNVEAYDTYKWVAARAPGTPQAEKAQKAVSAYDADPAFVTAYKKAARDKEAAATLWLAKSLEQSGKEDQAKSHYAKIVSEFADTPSAAAAKEAIKRLK